MCNQRATHYFFENGVHGCLPPSMANETAHDKACSPERKAILVLGMHRSGTSAVAGLIRLLGASAPKTLLMESESNPLGHWECLPLVLAHEEMLAAAGSSWDDWRKLDARWTQSQSAQQYSQRVKRIIREEYGEERVFFIKDPRICRFTSFLLSALSDLNISAVAFVPLRNPLEVAYSLKRRNGFSLDKGLLLWLRHALEAEFQSRQIPRAFLRYDQVLSDWRPHLERAANKTSVVWPPLFDDNLLKIEQFLTWDLYHERRTITEMEAHPEVSPWIVETFRDLLELVCNDHDAKVLDRLDSVRTKFNESCS
jgi:hypothetical protein